MEANRHTAQPVTETTQPRVVITWTGANQPITLTLYSANGGVAALELSPTRALELAKELIEPAVQSIKIDQWAVSPRGETAEGP